MPSYMVLRISQVRNRSSRFESKTNLLGKDEPLWQSTNQFSYTSILRSNGAVLYF